MSVEMKCVQCQTDCYDSTSALCPECWLKARPSSHTLDPIVSLPLWEVDFEEKWIKLQLTDEIMAKGFCAGSVQCNLSDVQRQANAKVRVSE